MRPGLIITARDEKVLLALQTCGLLTTTQIRDRIFTGLDISTVLRRLRKLSRYKVVLKELGLHQGPLVWRLSPKGAALLGAHSSYRDVNRNQLEHELMLSSIYLHLLGHGVTEAIEPGYIMKQQLKARAERGQGEGEQLIPDALFSVRRPPTARTSERSQSVALEVELTAKSKSRYRAILSRYARKGGLGLIWYILPTKGLGETLCGLWDECRASMTDNRLVWSLLADALKPPSEIILHSAAKSARLSDVVSLIIKPTKPCPTQRPPAGQSAGIHQTLSNAYSHELTKESK